MIFIGNCSHVIDWEALINELDHTAPEYVGPRHDVGHDVPGVEEVGRPLRNAGYKFVTEGGSLGWDMFLPDRQFDKKIADTFAEWAGMGSYINAWISRVNPGNMAAWHWDVTDHEETLAKNEHKRYHVHISKPHPGHFFLIEDTVFYGKSQGDAFQWPSRRSWHAGANAGLIPKYQFNIWG